MNFTLKVILVVTLVTALIRFLPFMIFSGKKKVPEIITKLGALLPYAIMGMLVIYCLKNVTFTSISSFLPELIASLVVISSYVWKRNSLLSIISGTAIYMILLNLLK